MDLLEQTVSPQGARVVLEPWVFGRDRQVIAQRPDRLLASNDFPGQRPAGRLPVGGELDVKFAITQVGDGLDREIGG